MYIRVAYLPETAGSERHQGLEKAESRLAVRNKQVLGLAVVVKGNLVRLTADTAALVTAKGSMRGVSMVVVDPDTTGVDATGHEEGLMGIAGENTGAKAKLRVIGNFNGLLGRLEGAQAGHRAKDFLLEDAHLVVAAENGWLNVKAALDDLGHIATGQNLGALLTTNLQVLLNLVILLQTGLGTNLGVHIQGVANLHAGNAFLELLLEGIGNAFLNQDARGAGADLALVEGEKCSTLKALVKKLVVGIHDALEEDIGRLATQLQRDGNNVVGGSHHNFFDRWWSRR